MIQKLSTIFLISLFVTGSLVGAAILEDTVESIAPAAMIPEDATLPMTQAGRFDLPGQYGVDVSPEFGVQGTPAFVEYAMISRCNNAGEPTIGIPPQSDDVFLQAGWATCRTSFDDENLVNGLPSATIVDVSSPFSITNVDPMMHTDAVTGRTFVGGLDGPCSIMSFSDDNGESWLPAANMCTFAQFDHQSLGSGPWTEALSEVGAANEDRAYYYCAQLALTACTTSYDGGITWGPITEVLGSCGGLHGHIRASEITGTAIVPHKGCMGFAISTNNGLTWNSRSTPLPSAKSGDFDPNADFSEESGWLYFAHAGQSGIHVALSKDEGLTWEPLGGVLQDKSLDIGQFHDPPIESGIFADVVAGDDDRAMVSFLGSTKTGSSGMYNACNDNSWVWHYYVASTYDAGQTWTVERATEDPVKIGAIWSGQGGTCRNLLDFNDMKVDSQGRVYVGFADALVGSAAQAWVDAATASGDPYSANGRSVSNSADQGRLLRQTTGRGIYSAFDADGGSGVSTPTVTITTPEENQQIEPGMVTFEGTAEYVYENAPLAAYGAGGDGVVGAPVSISGFAAGGNSDAGYTCNWVNADGSFADANACSTSVTFSTEGTYNLVFTVNDGSSSAQDLVEISISSAAFPEANADYTGGTTIFPSSGLLAYNELGGTVTGFAGDPVPKFLPGDAVEFNSRFTVSPVQPDGGSWVVWSQDATPLATANCAYSADTNNGATPNGWNCKGATVLPSAPGIYFAGLQTDDGTWVTHNAPNNDIAPQFKAFEILAPPTQMSAALPAPTQAPSECHVDGTQSSAAVPHANILCAWFESDANYLYAGILVEDIPADTATTAQVFYDFAFMPSWDVSDLTASYPNTRAFRFIGGFIPADINNLGATTFNQELQVLFTSGTGNSYATFNPTAGSTVSAETNILWFILERDALNTPNQDAVITGEAMGTFSAGTGAGVVAGTLNGLDTQTGPASSYSLAGATVSDRDGDGVPDDQDACPDTFGTGPDGCPITTASSRVALLDGTTELGSHNLRSGDTAWQILADLGSYEGVHSFDAVWYDDAGTEIARATRMVDVQPAIQTERQLSITSPAGDDVLEHSLTVTGDYDPSVPVETSASSTDLLLDWQNPSSGGTGDFVEIRTPDADSAIAGVTTITGVAGQSTTDPLKGGPDGNGDGWVVIAVIDTGINPYSSEFGMAEGQPDGHPSGYISGFPGSASAIDLTCTASNPSTGCTSDFAGVASDTLYWIPGTKIIGAMSTYSSDGATKILDEHGHGTASASVAAGLTTGTCPKCLIVVVDDIGMNQVEWAVNQPWIDLVTNSWGAIANVGTGPGSVLIDFYNVDDTRAYAEKGGTSLWAAGNGVANAFLIPHSTYQNEIVGADWHYVVGAAIKGDGGKVAGSGFPVITSSWGSGPIGSACHNSNGPSCTHGGTSAATPITAGVMGSVLTDAKRLLGSSAEGPEGNGIAAKGTAVPGNPFLDDGELSRKELWSVVAKTAKPLPSGPNYIYPLGLWQTSYDYLYTGYGLVSEDSLPTAIEVLRGNQTLPNTDRVDQWMVEDSNYRQTFFGGWNDVRFGFEADATPTLVPPMVAPTFDELAEDVFGLLVDDARPEGTQSSKSFEQPNGQNTFYLEDVVLGNEHNYALDLPAGATYDVTFTMAWESLPGQSDLDLYVTGLADSGSTGATVNNPETVTFLDLEGGTLNIRVVPYLVDDPLSGATYTLTAEITSMQSADSDVDGVPDGVDQCPNTTAGAVVDSEGCALSGAAVQLTFNGGSAVTVFTDAQGAWSYDFDTAGYSGPVTVAAAVGTATDSRTFQVEGASNPLTLSADGPASGNEGELATFTVTPGYQDGASGNPGMETVTVFVNEASVHVESFAYDQADKSFEWSFSPTAGEYALRFVYEDAAGFQASTESTYTANVILGPCEDRSNQVVVSIVGTEHFGCTDYNSASPGSWSVAFADISDLADGTYTVQADAYDAEGTNPVSDTTTFTLVTNQAPELIVEPQYEGAEGTDLVFEVVATDDRSTPVVSAHGLPDGASFDGRFVTWVPGFDQAGEYPVTFTADDGELVSEADTVLIVANVNQAPQLVADDVYHSPVRDTLTFTVSAVDDEGTPVITAQNLPDGATFDGQTFSWTTKGKDVGTYEVTFTADDGELQGNKVVQLVIERSNKGRAPA